ncbi:MAG: DUF1844 domain-containing protein [Pyrinomonadaceae bacterium]|nr:DUF1844 domain-containing protein [Blastocatellia bacterium]MCW5958359.1 DUF1844 domain-containing protein [Pyrinomonadaceae bacterium]
MIGRDENQEEVLLKVVDKRKFNPDGSLKEGIVIEPEPKKPEPEKPAAKPAAPVAANEMHDALDEVDYAPDLSEDAEDGSDIPGADDPASFVNFLSTLATNAAAALGAVPHPATGQRTLDLDSGKFWIDVLAMLRDKTKGNLHEKEARLLDGLLADLRMQYVTMVRATEEKLKAQAAKKFSGADILGKK